MTAERERESPKEEEEEEEEEEKGRRGKEEGVLRLCYTWLLNLKCRVISINFSAQTTKKAQRSG